jgi:hypothetical protein
MPTAIDRFFDLLQVYDVPGFTKKRIGRKSDGGYVVLDELCDGSTVFSYGVGDDVSFEEDFVWRYNGRARCFDHTVDGIPTTDPRITFQKHGLGTGEKHLRLPRQDISEDVFATGYTVPRMLKIDIEYHEWDYLAHWFDSVETCCHQIVIELHILPVRTFHPDVPYKIEGRDLLHWDKLSPYFRQFYARFDTSVNEKLFQHYWAALSRLTANYAIFHVHGNNSLPKVSVGDYDWPPLLELSLVRKDLVPDRTPTVQTFPVSDLDFPNKTNRPDFKYVLPFKVCPS